MTTFQHPVFLTHTPDGVRRSRHHSLSLYGLDDGDPRTTLSAEAVTRLAEITRLARTLTGSDTAAVTVLPPGRQVVLASSGGPTIDIPESDSICGALLASRPTRAVVVPDAAADPRFASNPYVDGRLGRIRGYALAPLLGHERLAIGTLCVASSRPRQLGETTVSLLEAFALATVKVLDDERRDLRLPGRFPARSVSAELGGRLLLEA